MKLAHMVVLLTGVIGWPLAAQVWDNTGNGKLSGTYYFRQVLFTSTDEVAVYGNIVFSGNGTYTITGTQAIDCSFQSGNCGYVSPASSGTYTISASGYGAISSPVTGTVYGLVGANGVFVGSTTESATNDLFIAAPMSGQSAGTLQGSYSLAYLYPGSQVPYDALLQLTSNGSGSIGTVSVSYYTTSSSAVTQSISGVKYTVSNNAFVVAFPASTTAAVSGTEYLYSTPDGSFVFGGSPLDFDMIVGVRTGSSGSGFGGSYYEAGMNIDNSQLTSTGYSYLGTYYGSFYTTNGAVVGHQRQQNGSGTAVGYTYTDSYPANSGGSYSDAFTSTQYIGGNGGAVRIGVGIGPYLGVSVSVLAPTFSGSGVYLYPNGVLNAASWAPFTAGVARGELVILYGTNLGPSTFQQESSVPWPTTLGGVQVLVNGIEAPLYYVSSNQIAAIVPWEISASIAQFQVVNNGVTSNAVTEFVNETAPGVFTDTANGIGYALAVHQDGQSLVTASSPAQPGETISVYLAGLGDVFPSIKDGAAGPTSTLSNTSNTITAYINGTQANVTYAGLAPQWVSLYQVNLTIPSGTTSGDTYLDISGPDSYSTEALISIGASTATAVPGAEPRLHRRPLAARPMQHWGGRPALVQ